MYKVKFVGFMFFFVIFFVIHGVYNEKLKEREKERADARSTIEIQTLEIMRLQSQVEDLIADRNEILVYKTFGGNQCLPTLGQVYSLTCL